MTMDDYGRPRKQIEASGKAAGRRSPASMPLMSNHVLPEFNEPVTGNS